MRWFTHFTRPPRKGLAPPGRNHVRRSDTRTLCGVTVPRWLRRPVVILDPLTGRRAYPDCRRCARLEARSAPDVPPRHGAAGSSRPPAPAAVRA